MQGTERLRRLRGHVHLLARARRGGGRRRRRGAGAAAAVRRGPGARAAAHPPHRLSCRRGRRVGTMAPCPPPSCRRAASLRSTTWSRPGMAAGLDAVGGDAGRAVRHHAPAPRASARPPGSTVACGSPTGTPRDPPIPDGAARRPGPGGRRPQLPPGRRAPLADGGRAGPPGGPGGPLRLGRPLRARCGGPRRRGPGASRPPAGGPGAGRRQRPGRPRGRLPGRARLVRQERQPAAARARAAGSCWARSSPTRRCRRSARRGPVADGCGTCTRCLDGCPTGAIVAPGVVDARRCLAWLVQARGAVSPRAPGRPRRPPLRLRRLPGGVPAEPPRRPGGGRRTGRRRAARWPTVAVLELLAATDDELLARHGRWYIPGRAAAVPAAQRARGARQRGRRADPRVVAALAAALADADPLLRRHAVWAARRLGRDDLVARGWRRHTTPTRWCRPSWPRPSTRR